MIYKLIAYSDTYEFWISQGADDEPSDVKLFMCAKELVRSKYRSGLCTALKELVEITFDEFDTCFEHVDGCKFTAYGAKFVLELSKCT